MKFDASLLCLAVVLGCSLPVPASGTENNPSFADRNAAAAHEQSKITNLGTSDIDLNASNESVAQTREDRNANRNIRDLSTEPADSTANRASSILGSDQPLRCSH